MSVNICGHTIHAPASVVKTCKTVRVTVCKLAEKRPVKFIIDNVLELNSRITTNVLYIASKTKVGYLKAKSEHKNLEALLSGRKTPRQYVSECIQGVRDTLSHLIECIPQDTRVNLSSYFTVWLPVFLLIFCGTLWSTGKTMMTSTTSDLYYPLTHYNSMHYYSNVICGLVATLTALYVHIPTSHSLYIWLSAITVWVSAAGASAFVVPLMGFTFHPYLVVVYLFTQLDHRLHFSQLLAVIALRVSNKFDNRYATIIGWLLASCSIVDLAVFGYHQRASLEVMPVILATFNLYNIYKYYTASNYCIQCRCGHDNACENPSNITTYWFLPCARNAIPRVYLINGEEKSENVRNVYLKYNAAGVYKHSILDVPHLSWTKINKNTIVRDIPEPVDLPEGSYTIHSKPGSTLVNVLDQNETGLNCDLPTNKRYVVLKPGTDVNELNNFAITNGLSIQYMIGDNTTEVVVAPFDATKYMALMLCLAAVVPFDFYIAAILAAISFTFIILRQSMTGNLRLFDVIPTGKVHNMNFTGGVGFVFNLIMLLESYSNVKILTNFVPLYLAYQTFGLKALCYLLPCVILFHLQYSYIAAIIIIFVAVCLRRWHYVFIGVGVAIHSVLSAELTPATLFALSMYQGVTPYQTFLYVYSILFRAEFSLATVHTTMLSIIVAVWFKKYMIAVALSTVAWARYYSIMVSSKATVTYVGYSFYKDVSYFYYIQLSYFIGVALVLPIVCYFSYKTCRRQMQSFSPQQLVQLLLALIGSFAVWVDLYVKTRTANSVAMSVLFDIDYEHDWSNLAVEDVDVDTEDWEVESEEMHVTGTPDVPRKKNDTEKDKKNKQKWFNCAMLITIVCLIAFSASARSDPKIQAYNTVNSYAQNSAVFDDIMKASITTFNSNYTFKDVDVGGYLMASTVQPNHGASIQCKEDDCVVKYTSPGVDCTYQVHHGTYTYTTAWDCEIQPGYAVYKRKAFSSENILPHAPWLCKSTPGSRADNGHMLARMLGGQASWFNCMPQTHADNLVQVTGEMEAKIAAETGTIKYSGVVRPYSGRYVVVGDYATFRRCVQGEMTLLKAESVEQLIDMFVQADKPTYILVDDHILNDPRASHVVSLASKECTASPLIKINGKVSTDIVQTTPSVNYAESLNKGPQSQFTIYHGVTDTVDAPICTSNTITAYVVRRIIGGYDLPQQHVEQLTELVCKIVSAASSSQVATIVIDRENQMYLDLIVAAVSAVNRIWGKDLIHFASSTIAGFKHIVPEFTVVPCETVGYINIASLPILVDDNGYCNTPDGISTAHAVANAHNKKVYYRNDYCTVVKGQVYINLNPQQPCTQLDYFNIPAHNTSIVHLDNTPGFNQFMNGAFDAFVREVQPKVGREYAPTCSANGLPVKFYKSGKLQLTCSLAFLNFRPEGLVYDKATLFDTYVLLPNVSRTYQSVDATDEVQNYHPLFAYLPFWPTVQRTMQDKCLHEYLTQHGLPEPDFIPHEANSNYDHGLCQLLTLTLESRPRSALATYSGYITTGEDVYDIPSAIDSALTSGYMSTQCGRSALDSPYVRNFLHIPVYCYDNPAQFNKALLAMYGVGDGNIQNTLLHNTLKDVPHKFTMSSTDIQPTMECKLLYKYSGVDESFCKSDKFVYGPGALKLIRAGRFYGRQHFYLPIPGVSTYITVAAPTVGIPAIDDAVLQGASVKVDAYYWQTSARAFNLLPYPRATVCATTNLGVETCVKYISNPIIVKGLEITFTQDHFTVQLGDYKFVTEYDTIYHDIAHLLLNILKAAAYTLYDIMYSISRFNFLVLTIAATATVIVLALVHTFLPFPTAVLIYTNPLPLMSHYVPQLAMVTKLYDIVLFGYSLYNGLWSIQGQDPAAFVRRVGILTIYIHYVFGTQTTLGYVIGVAIVCFVAYQVYLLRTLKPWHKTESYTKDQVCQLYKKYIESQSVGGKKSGADIVNDLFTKNMIDKLQHRFYLALASSMRADVGLEYTPPELVNAKNGNFVFTIILSKMLHYFRKFTWYNGKPLDTYTESATLNSPIIEEPDWAHNVMQYIHYHNGFAQIQATKGDVYVRHSYANTNAEAGRAAFKNVHGSFEVWGDTFLIPKAQDGLIPAKFNGTTHCYMYCQSSKTWRTGYISPDGTHSVSTQPGDSGSPIFIYDGKPRWVGIHVRGGVDYYNSALTYDGYAWKDSPKHSEFNSMVEKSDYVTPVEPTMAARILLHTYKGFGFRSAEECKQWYVIGVTDINIFTKPVQQQLSAILQALSPAAIRSTLNIKYTKLKDLKPLVAYAKIDTISTFNSFMRLRGLKGLINIVETPFYIKWPLIVWEQICMYAFVHLIAYGYGVVFESHTNPEIMNEVGLSTNYGWLLLPKILFTVHMPYNAIVEPLMMLLFVLYQLYANYKQYRVDGSTIVKHIIDGVFYYLTWFGLYYITRMESEWMLCVVAMVFTLYVSIMLRLSKRTTQSFNVCESLVDEKKASNVRKLAIQLQTALTAARITEYNSELEDIINNSMSYSFDQLKYTVQRLMDIYHTISNHAENDAQYDIVQDKFAPVDLYLAALNFQEGVIGKVVEYFGGKELSEIVGLLIYHKETLQGKLSGDKNEDKAINRFLGVYDRVIGQVRKEVNRLKNQDLKNNAHFNKLAKVICTTMDQQQRQHIKEEAARQAFLRFLEEFPTLQGLMASQGSLPDPAEFQDIVQELQGKYSCGESRPRIVHTDGLTWDDEYIITSPQYQGYKIYAQIVSEHLCKVSTDMKGRSILIGLDLKPAYYCVCNGLVTFDTLDNHDECQTPVLKCSFYSMSKLATLQHVATCPMCRMCPFASSKHPDGMFCHVCPPVTHDIHVNNTESYSANRESTTARLIPIVEDGVNVLFYKSCVVASKAPRNTLDGRPFVPNVVAKEGSEDRVYYVNPDYPSIDFMKLDANYVESTAVTFIMQNGGYYYGGVCVARLDKCEGSIVFNNGVRDVYVLQTPFISMAYRKSSYARSLDTPRVIAEPQVTKNGHGSQVREGILVDLRDENLLSQLRSIPSMSEVVISDTHRLFVDADRSVALEVARSHFGPPVKYAISHTERSVSKAQKKKISPLVFLVEPSSSFSAAATEAKTLTFGDLTNKAREYIESVGGQVKEQIPRAHYIRADTGNVERRGGFFHLGTHDSVIPFTLNGKDYNIKVALKRSELEMDKHINTISSHAIRFVKKDYDGCTFYQRQMSYYSLLDLVTERSRLPYFEGRCQKIRCGHDVCFELDLKRAQYFMPIVQRVYEFTEDASQHYTFKIVPDNITTDSRCVCDWGDFVEGPCDPIEALSPFFYFMERYRFELGFTALTKAHVMGGKIVDPLLDYDEYLKFYKYESRLGFKPIREPFTMTATSGFSRHIELVQEAARFYVSEHYDQYNSTYYNFSNSIYPGFGFVKRQLYTDHVQDESVAATYMDLLSVEGLLRQLESAPYEWKSHYLVHDSYHSSCQTCNMIAIAVEQNTAHHGYSNVMTLGITPFGTKKAGNLTSCEYYVDTDFLERIEGMTFYTTEGEDIKIKVRTNSFADFDDNGQYTYVLGSARVAGNLDDVQKDLNFYNLNQPVITTLSEYVISFIFVLQQNELSPNYDAYQLACGEIKTGKKNKSAGPVFDKEFNAGALRSALGSVDDRLYEEFLEDVMNSYRDAPHLMISQVMPKVAVQPSNKPLRSIIAGSPILTDCIRCVIQSGMRAMVNLRHVFIGNRANPQGFTEMLKFLKESSADSQVSLDHSKFDRFVASGSSYAGHLATMNLTKGQQYSPQLVHNLMVSHFITYTYNALLFDGKLNIKNGGISSGNSITALNNSLAAQQHSFICAMREATNGPKKDWENQLMFFDLLMDPLNLCNKLPSKIWEIMRIAGLSDDVVACVPSNLIDCDALMLQFQAFGYKMVKDVKYFVSRADEPPTELMSRWAEFYPHDPSIMIPHPTVDRVLSSALLIEKRASLDPLVKRMRIISILLDSCALVFSKNRTLELGCYNIPATQVIMALLDYLNELSAFNFSLNVEMEEIQNLLINSTDANALLKLSQMTSYTLDDFLQMVLPMEAPFEVIPVGDNYKQVEENPGAGVHYLVPIAKYGYGLAKSYDLPHNIEDQLDKNRDLGDVSTFKIGDTTYTTVVCYQHMTKPNVFDINPYTRRYEYHIETKAIVLHFFRGVVTKLSRDVHFYLPCYQQKYGIQLALNTMDLPNITVYRNHPDAPARISLCDQTEALLHSKQCVYCEHKNANLQCLTCLEHGLIINLCQNMESGTQHYIMHYQSTGHTKYSFGNRQLKCIVCQSNCEVPYKSLKGMPACQQHCNSEESPVPLTHNVTEFNYNRYSTIESICAGVNTTKVHTILTNSLHDKVLRRLYFLYISYNKDQESTEITEVLRVDGRRLASVPGLPYQRSALYRVGNQVMNAELVCTSGGRYLYAFNGRFNVGDQVKLITNNVLFEHMRVTPIADRALEYFRPAQTIIPTRVPRMLLDKFPLHHDFINHIFTYNYTLLQGVAGAGKSYFIRHCIEACVEQGMRVVVACQSHEAVDLLGIALSTHLKDRACRVCPKEVEKVHTKLNPMSSVANPRIYYTTIASMLQLSNRTYDLLIVDEASQVNDAAIALALTKVNYKHVLFCGDPQQIPTVLTVPHKPKLANMYVRSSDHFKFTHTRRFGVTLAIEMTRHYGMEITSLAEHSTSIKLFKTSDLSWNACLQAVVCLAKHQALKQLDDALIVTPYNKLVALYKSIVSYLGLNIRVLTVYQSQGDEAPAVLYDPAIGYGSLDEPHIHIVGMSRAREHLLIKAADDRWSHLEEVEEIPLTCEQGSSNGFVFPSRYQYCNAEAVNEFASCWLLGPVRGLPNYTECGRTVIEEKDSVYAPTIPVRHPRHNTVVLDVECVSTRDLQHTSRKKGVPVPSLAPCALSFQIGDMPVTTKYFRPSIHDGHEYWTSRDYKVLPMISHLRKDIVRAKQTRQAVLQGFLEMLHQHITGVPHFYFKAGKLDLNCLQPILRYTGIAAVCEHDGCSYDAVFWCSTNRTMCVKHTRHPLALVNIQYHDIDMMYSRQVKLETMHDEICGVDHGTAHDPATDVKMTKCIVVNYHRTLDYSQPTAGCHKHTPALGSIMRNIKKLFEVDNTGDYTYVGGGSVIGNKSYNVDKMYGRDYYEHLTECQCKSHVMLDFYEDSVHDKTDRYLVRSYLDMQKSWHKDSLETTKAKNYWYTDNDPFIYPHRIKFPSRCSGSYVKPDTELLVEPCHSSSLCLHHHQLLTKLESLLKQASLIGLKLDHNLVIAYVPSNSVEVASLYKINDINREPKLMDSPPLTLRGYVHNGQTNPTVNKAITIHEKLMSESCTLGRTLLAGSAGSDGCQPMADYLAKQVNCKLVTCDPRPVRANKGLHHNCGIEELPRDYKFDTIISDIYDVHNPINTHESIVEYALSTLQRGGNLFVKITMTSTSEVYDVLATKFRYVEIFKAIHPTYAVTSELWIWFKGFQPDLTISRDENYVSRLYNGNLHYLNQHPHKHKMLKRAVRPDS
ncbi:1ab [Beihai Nido-like virus 2]|uniref:Replicase polyprotein 1ab n=1 Tax=Beihai Nido-like virus 2 TaxID=1922351 RepID=A0A1L3KIX8_9NIDO|nr:1ab [Beihai Nido-like virus 2]APG77322.1 1ab [Beihai Nido-like virus 2]